MRGFVARCRAAGGRMVLALGLVLAVVVAGTAVANLEFDRRVDAVPRVDVAGLASASGSARNYLLVGSDSREFVGDDPEAAAAFGTEADTGPRRSDTMMIVHADDTGGFVVSLPRDLWVEIPGRGGAKINAAYNDGPSKVVETIEANLGVPIHHYLEVDFAGFTGIVDAVGGVSMYFPAPVRDAMSGLDVATAPACVVLDGDQALAFVRARSYQELVGGEWVSDPTGDIGRMSRQQVFLRRLAADTIASVVARPLDARDVADATVDLLTMDSSMGPDDVRSLLRAFRAVEPDDPGSLELITMPWTTGPSQGGQSVLYLEEDAAAEVIARLRDPGRAAAPEGEAVNPSSVRVRVLNGTDVTGLAGETADALAGEGFVPGGTGDSDRTPVAITEVRHRPGGDAHARTVLAALGGAATMVEDDAIVDADVVVVLGADFAGVSAGTEDPGTAAPGDGGGEGDGGDGGDAQGAPPELEPGC